LGCTASTARGGCGNLAGGARDCRGQFWASEAADVGRASRLPGNMGQEPGARSRGLTTHHSPPCRAWLIARIGCRVAEYNFCPLRTLRQNTARSPGVEYRAFALATSDPAPGPWLPGCRDPISEKSIYVRLFVAFKSLSCRTLRIPPFFPLISGSLLFRLRHSHLTTCPQST